MVTAVAHLDMLQLDQLAEMLAPISREKILPLKSQPGVQTPWVAHLEGQASEIGPSRRSANAGDVLEHVSASFPGVHKSSRAYMVLCVPATPPANDDALHERTKQESSAVMSVSVSSLPPPLPRPSAAEMPDASDMLSNP